MATRFKEFSPRIKSNFMKCLSFPDGLWAYCNVCRKNKDNRRRFEKTKKLFSSTNGKCYYCGCDLIWGEPRMWHIEHRMPIILGGLDEISNISPSCPECNIEKHIKTDIEYLNYRKSKGLKINPERIS